MDAQTPARAGRWYGPYEGTPPLYGLVVAHDHHGSGLSEDAPPIWTFKRPADGLIGVFDGVGGADGETIRFSDGSEHTSAWLASRHVRDCVIHVHQELIQQVMTSRAAASQTTAMPGFYDCVDFTAELKRAIERKLGTFAAKVRASGAGRLRSRLIKMLPTTMAICSYDLSKREFGAVWAGDSRVYSIRPDDGLQQVTTDDLNCVSAGDFVLHERRLALRSFTILIAASDGCFGYARTPLHFEYLLLQTMQESADWADWRMRLESRIAQVTDDDSTLAAVAIGWPDFASCRANYSARADWCWQRIRALDDRHDRVQRLERDLLTARGDLTSNTATLWREYRTTYESLALAPTRDVPRQAQSRPGSQ
jgi:hypothetical protein